MSKIQEDCYWFIDARLPENERKIQAMCVDCHRTNTFGWFWLGSHQGYGDYDLRCSICGKSIHERETNKNKAAI